MLRLDGSTKGHGDHEISWPIVQAAFAAHATAVLPEHVPAVQHPGIDETRRGKAKLRLVARPNGGEVWEVVADRWHRLRRPDRRRRTARAARGPHRRVGVRLDRGTARRLALRGAVQMVAIDMCTVFKAAVRDNLPHAILVVDRFHVAQLANTALTEARRRVTLQVRGRRGRKGNREWELRNRLTLSAARMHADHIDPMVEDLRALPKKIGGSILAAWNVNRT